MWVVGSIEIWQLMIHCIPDRDLSVGGASLRRQTLLFETLLFETLRERERERNEHRAVKSVVESTSDWTLAEPIPWSIGCLTKINYALKVAFDLLSLGLHGAVGH
jgi:hypothetical protein